MMKIVLALIAALALAGCATTGGGSFQNKKQDRIYPKNRNVAQSAVVKPVAAPLVAPSPIKPVPKPKPKKPPHHFRWF